MPTLAELPDARDSFQKRGWALLRMIACAVGAVLVIIVALLFTASQAPNEVVLGIWGCAAVSMWPIVNQAINALRDYQPRDISKASGDARMATRQDLEKYGLFNGDPSYDIRCGFYEGKPVYYTGEAHCTLSGDTRSGKDMRWITDNLRRLNRSIVLMDPKGQQAAMTGRRRIAMGSDVIMLNPFGELVDKRPYMASVGFNVLLAIDPDNNNFFSDCFGIVETMVLIEGNDPHWNRRGQALACAVIMGVKWDEKEGKIKVATMKDVKSRLSRPYKTSDGSPSLYDDLKKMSKYNDSAAEIANNFLSGSDDPKEIEGVISSIWGQMNFLHDPTLIKDLSNHPKIRVGKELCAVLRDRGINVRKGDMIPFNFEYLKHQNITVYVILPVKKLRTHSLWLRLIIGNAINSLSGLPGDIKPILMINEAGNLGRLKSLESGMSILAGMGVTIMTLWQSHWQIRKHYDDAGEFTGGAGFIGTLTANDSDTPSYFSGRSGTQTVLIKNYGRLTKFKNETTALEQRSSPLIHHTHITGMPEGEAIAWIRPCPHPIKLDVLGHWDIKGPKIDPDLYFIPKKPRWL